MEEVNRNGEKRLPERETEVEIRSGNVTKDEPAPRKETTNRSVNPGQVLPLMQIQIDQDSFTSLSDLTHGWFSSWNVNLSLRARFRFANWNEDLGLDDRYRLLNLRVDLSLSAMLKNLGCDEDSGLGTVSGSWVARFRAGFSGRSLYNGFRSEDWIQTLRFRRSDHGYSNEFQRRGNWNNLDAR
ncbi:hypothetical protein WN48_05219 [Eufriesea mexicana]|uniref:Uncharacterized protein n=1 Tax=Eufriesea mexicana TaxID=516756 RepID=A0A310S9K3_9HYME|nr:hypothetical protein WN48_05219 [Eufriesea mexicana]